MPVRKHRGIIQSGPKKGKLKPGLDLILLVFQGVYGILHLPLIIMMLPDSRI